jgi:hypothetical protein
MWIALTFDFDWGAVGTDDFFAMGCVDRHGPMRTLGNATGTGVVYCVQDEKGQDEKNQTPDEKHVSTHLVSPEQIGW